MPDFGFSPVVSNSNKINSFICHLLFGICVVLVWILLSKYAQRFLIKDLRLSAGVKKVMKRFFWEIGMKRYLANWNGYSLTELLVTISVLGIVLAMAVPDYSKWVLKRQINAESQKLYMDLMLARISAIKNNNDVIVTFNAGNNQYQLHDDTDSDGVEDGGETIKIVTLIPQVQFGFFGGSVIDMEGNSVNSAVYLAGGGSVLTFNSKGQASDSGSVYLIPASDAGQSNDRLRAVSVIQATGSVDYWKYNEGQSPPWS